MAVATFPIRRFHICGRGGSDTDTVTDTNTNRMVNTYLTGVLIKVVYEVDRDVH